MSKNVKQKKKSKTQTKPVKKTAPKAKKAAPKVKLAAEVKPAKTAVAQLKGPAKAKPVVKSEPVQSAVVTAAIPASGAETVVAKPAISGREAARLAMVQKAATSKWAALQLKAAKIPVSPYNLKNQYEIETAISHKTLGWGYIQDKKNDRLEVLFENGIKYLISNYK